ncbi:hypothetical protein BDF19DRAFT_446207 [Syncephalis fuscata]|nr:hypothetical protein BDF19DRAFT_446207 [Syncephalis fuscata]
MIISNPKPLIALVVAASTLVSAINATPPPASASVASSAVRKEHLGQKESTIRRFDVNEIFKGKLRVYDAFGISGLFIEKASYHESGYIVTRSRLGNSKVQFICGDDEVKAPSFRFFKDAYELSQTHPGLYEGTEYVSGPKQRVFEPKFKLECFLGTQSDGGTALEDIFAGGNISVEVATKYVERISKGLQYMRTIGWMPSKMDHNFVGDKNGYLFYRSHADSVDLNSKDLSLGVKKALINDYNETLWGVLGKLYKIILKTKDYELSKEEVKKRYIQYKIVF